MDIDSERPKRPLMMRIQHTGNDSTPCLLRTKLASMHFHIIKRVPRAFEPPFVETSLAFVAKKFGDGSRPEGPRKSSESSLILQISSKRSLMNGLVNIWLCLVVIAATEAELIASASSNYQRCLQSGSGSQSNDGLPFDVGVLGDGSSVKEAQETNSSSAAVSAGDDQSVGGSEVFNSSLSHSGSDDSSAFGSLKEPTQDTRSDASHSSGNSMKGTKVPTSAGNPLQPLTVALTLWIGIVIAWSV